MHAVTLQWQSEGPTQVDLNTPLSGSASYLASELIPVRLESDSSQQKLAVLSAWIYRALSCCGKRAYNLQDIAYAKAPWNEWDCFHLPYALCLSRCRTMTELWRTPTICSPLQTNVLYGFHKVSQCCLTYFTGFTSLVYTI